MNKRTFSEIIEYAVDKISKMDIPLADKLTMVGLLGSLSLAHETERWNCPYADKEVVE